jgi:O-methyltransferase involved in polyketide biosynthesis
MDLDGPPSRRSRIRVDLSGVPETTLLTLYYRAHEATSAFAVLDDPKAVELLAAIDFDFFGRFGPATPVFGRYIGLRAAAFDAQVRRFMAAYPGAAVAALGEGLETQFWRVDDGRVRWFTVELPQTAAVRAALLPDDPPRRRMFAGSALEPEWLAALDAGPADHVMVVAQGLLMYLPPEAVRALIARCAAAFPGGSMIFDTMPRRLTALTTSGRARRPGGYQPPPMPWGVTAGRLVDELRLEPWVGRVQLVDPPVAGDPATRTVLTARRLLPGLRRHGPAVVRIDFRRRPEAGAAV